MIDRMTRYSFILLNRETEQFISSLQELGVLDISRSAKPVDEASAALLNEAEALKEEIRIIEKEDFSKDEEYTSLSEALATAKKEYEERAPWGEFTRESVTRLTSQGLAIDCYSCPKSRFDGSWAEQNAMEIISEDRDKVHFVVVRRQDETSSVPLQAVQLSEDDCREAQSRIESLEGRLASRTEALKARRSDIPALQARYDSTVSELDSYLARQTAEKSNDELVDVLIGFAPADQCDGLDKVLDTLPVLYFKDDAKAADNPPIKLRNNRFVKMFEVLTDMYGRPAYDGFDPTPYISVFFLLFFAMCMGDAGYGLVLVIGGFLLKKVESFKSFAPLVTTLGAATFVVGLIFHTFFSVDISTWSCIPDAVKACMLPSKMAGFDGTMVAAIAIGVVHLCLAMIVKTVYATKNNGFLNSLGVWGWTLLIVGGVVVGAISLAGVIDARLTKIIVIALGCVSALGIFLLNDIHRNPLINIGSGLWETYNTVTGILGDVLSYLRLYALGLAGSMLGFAFNDLAGMTLGDGGFGWIPFILIVVVGHTLNVAMAVLGAFVHPLRLNFLEFFKNSGYEGAGRNYNPLTK